MRKRRRTLVVVTDDKSAAPATEPVAVDPSGETTASEHAPTSTVVSGPRHAGLWYTGARIVLLAVVAGILYLVGARGFLLLLLAFLISGLISFVVLAKWREALSVRLAERFTKINDKIEKSKTAEDDLL